MKKLNNNSYPKAGERGASVLEIIIVLAMVSIVATFAIVQIAAAQRSMRLTSAAREMMGWLEKARLDSLRRHPMSGSEMARVTITSANTYTVTIDKDGDGALDQPLTITIPGTNGAAFYGITLPTVIRFNWRGRPVDATGNPINLSFSLRDSGGNINPINVASTGDTSLDSNLSASPVSVSSGVNGTSNIRGNTRVP
ncbi:MAG TPA: type II secretion system protein [Pyrinomonadaceae bacterium]